MIFFLKLFILEEWNLLVINKDEDGLLEAKYHDIQLQCKYSYSEKIPCDFFLKCPLLLETFPGSLLHLPTHDWVGQLKLL